MHRRLGRTSHLPYVFQRLRLEYWVLNGYSVNGSDSIMLLRWEVEDVIASRGWSEQQWACDECCSLETWLRKVRVHCFFRQNSVTMCPASWTLEFWWPWPCGWWRISFLEGAKRGGEEGSCWQSFKWVCKWNGQQMALVRAPVVWDMLSMAVHLPDLATVLLPSHNRAPGAAGHESVLIQCVQLPPGGTGEEPPKQIQPNGPFDTDKSSTGHESGATKGSLATHSDCHMSRDKEKSSCFWLLLLTLFSKRVGKKNLCDVTKGT